MKFLGFFLVFCSVAIGQSGTFEEAEKLYKNKQFELAKNLFIQVVRQNPDNIQALEYLGDIEAHRQDWGEAMQYYRRVKDKKPRIAEHHYKYGGALGMYAKGINKFSAVKIIPEIRSTFEKAIELDTSHLGARWALLELYLQLPAIIGGSEKKSQRYAAELKTISPVDGYLAKGHIAEYFERFPEAEKYYKLALDIGKSKTCVEKLANLYIRMKKPEKARALRQKFSTTNQ